MAVEVIVLRNPLQPISALRVLALRSFGARIGKRVRIREGARVKYPWLLEIGSDCWIGEGAWLYNQAPLRIGDDVCISQGAFITCGTHDLDSMNLRVEPVSIGSRVWIASFARVLSGLTVADDSVLAASALLTRDVPEPGWIYAGVPARPMRRVIANEQTLT